jgi:transmembrane sensor
VSKLREPLRELLRDPVGDAQLDAIWRRVEVKRRPRTLRRALVPALVAVTALMIVVGERWPFAPHAAPSAGPLASAPAALRWSNGDALSAMSAVEVAPAAAKRVLALSDGTRVELASGSRLVPSSSTPEAVELALERGEARFEVAPQGTRRFEVQAGALRVRVVGTAFTVSRDRDADVARVVVEHGRVRVFSPAGEALLGAGDVLRWPAEASSAPVAPPPAVIVQAPQPSSSPARVKAGDDLGAWRAAAADGDYQRAYALLGARGYALVVRDESNVDVLLELADVARGAGHPRDAALALARVVQRYPHDARSPLAALTLGRLQLDALGQPSAAERTLRRALELGLPEALQEDALARLVQASAQAGDSLQARGAADEYRKRFANGRYRANVDQWSKAP